MLIILISVPSAVLGLFLLYLWAIHPDNSHLDECLHFTKWDFAHRGLWNLAEGIPENSLPAFRRAVEQGFAIELDVHLTKDGELVVFHDDTLTRMCRRNGTIESTTMDQLSACRLLDTGCHIPRLSEVLTLVNGQVPLLIELKLPTSDLSLCRRLKEELSTYRGRYLIESFNPLGLRWYRRHCPSVLRGQLAARYEPTRGLDALLKFLSTALLVNGISRPHFIAYNYRHATGLGFRLNQKLFHIPVFAWTIRSQEVYTDCKNRFSAAIFENFLPDTLKIRKRPS